jgi:YVTN family beta-propeller protein
VAWSPDGKRIYFGAANEGQVKALDVATGAVVASIDINDATHKDSFIGDFVLSRDGKTMYAVDQFNYRMVVVIDVEAGRVTRSVRVGRNPFAIALPADERSAWVSNVGMFEYPHPGDIMQGTLQIIPVPDDAAIAAMTQQVVRNTYVRREVTTEARAKLPFVNSRMRGPIKHIVFVVKENRTYDQVFGQRRGTRGDAANTTLGLGMRVASKDGTRVLERGT